jgi:hypothetical protein
MQQQQQQGHVGLDPGLPVEPAQLQQEVLRLRAQVCVAGVMFVARMCAGPSACIVCWVGKSLDALFKRKARRKDEEEQPHKIG